MMQDDFISIWFFMILRVIGFCMEKIDNPQDCKRYSLTNFIFYAHYPSFVYVSLFVPFENFIHCVSATSRFKKRYQSLK